MFPFMRELAHAAARSIIRTTSGTRWSEPGTDPSTQCRRHDRAGRSSSPAMAACHVLRNRGLSDIDAELEQFPMYPGRAPKRVCNAHLADQAANIHWYRRSATERSRFPAPIGSE